MNLAALSLHGLRDLAECLLDEEDKQEELASVLREIERRGDVEEEEEASQARRGCRVAVAVAAAAALRSVALRSRA
jgi:hypothetical protein